MTKTQKLTIVWFWFIDIPLWKYLLYIHVIRQKHKEKYNDIILQICAFNVISFFCPYQHALFLIFFDIQKRTHVKIFVKRLQKKKCRHKETKYISQTHAIKTWLLQISSSTSIALLQTSMASWRLFMFSSSIFWK